MFRCLAISILLLISVQVYGQSIEYARQIVNTLASDGFKGRGYVENGDSLAADYISQEFEKFGLQSFEDDYYQTFETSVNTFPGIVSLQINEKELKAGTDFLVHPGSPSLKGVFDIIKLTAEELLSDELFVNKLRVSSGHFILINPYDKNKFSTEENERLDDVINFLKFHPQNPSKGTIILTPDKLTWSGSTSKSPRPTLVINANTINDSFKFIELNIQSKFIERYQTQNVVGYLEGINRDSTIVFMAHYDHLGKLGTKTTFNGANDNASGVAMLLNLASYYAENKPTYNLAFIAFGAEELGLIGSRYFTENPLFELSSIKFFLNFDLAGTGDEGIQVVNGSVYKSQFDSLSTINERNDLLPQVKIRGAACNSDHCMFDQKDVPGFYIYTLGGIKAYHDVYDRPETLPLTEFQDYFKLITDFVGQF